MEKFSPKLLDLVYFQWEDHCSYHGSEWTRIDQIGKRLTGSMNETVGFVVDITKDHITTVAHIGINDEDRIPDGSQVATRLRRAITNGRILKRFT